jgi:Ca-activated chloride channel family protein
MADVEVKGRISGQQTSYQTRFAFPAVATDNPDIERLWAYARIEDAMAEMADFGEKADLKQAVVDLGVEYGLVTDYTSMVVVRDEIFDQRGIKRTNRDRLAIEAAASQQRANQAPVSRRVDSQQPMYTSSRPSFGGGGSGGGALDPWTLLLLLPLAWVAWSSRKRPVA